MISLGDAFVIVCTYSTYVPVVFLFCFVFLWVFFVFFWAECNVIQWIVWRLLICELQEGIIFAPASRNAKAQTVRGSWCIGLSVPSAKAAASASHNLTVSD